MNPAAMIAFAALAGEPSVQSAACPMSEHALAFEPASAQAPLMVLQGRIDPGGPVAVVFDTGASAPFDVFLSPSLANRLGLTLSDEIAPPDTTAIGSARQTYRTSRLEHFSLGPIALGRTEVAVVPMIDAMQAQVGRRIDAIVGHRLVADRVVGLDYGGRRIDLAARVGPDATALSFTLAARKPLVLVAMTVNGRGPFLMEIDTGATGTSLSPGAAQRAGVRAHGQGRMGGAGGQVDVGVARAEVTLGAVSRRLESIAISPAVDGVAASAGSRFDGILGGDFFSGACLTIDYPGKRLWVSAP